MATAAHSISDGAGRKYKPNSKEILDGRAPTQQYFLDEYAKQDWVAPWDLGKPQPCLVQAEQEGLLQGEILDVGCGPGDNAIYLATKGYQITAVDLSQCALDRAAKRTQAAGLAPGNPAFKQADLLNMGSTLGERQWDTALDSALLHCFPPETQQQYLRELHRHVKSGGRVVLFCMSDANKDPWMGPERLSRADLERLFSEKNGWELEQLMPAKFTTPIKEENFVHNWRGIMKRL